MHGVMFTTTSVINSIVKASFTLFNKNFVTKNHLHFSQVTKNSKLFKILILVLILSFVFWIQLEIVQIDLIAFNNNNNPIKFPSIYYLCKFSIHFCELQNCWKVLYNSTNFRNPNN